MTLHLSKDFLAKHASASTVFTRYYHLCISAYFLRGVMGFTVVGQTTFNLDGAAITKGSGVNTANINGGAGLERAVQLPGAYVVSAADIDRVLALKSNTNPLMNSGIFRVSGIDIPSNSLIMVARSWLDSPIAETGVTWRLFENEGVVTGTFLNGNNGNPEAGALTKYRGDGVATTSRIILQSPHSSGWQVRICAECVIDTDGSNYLGASCSFAPGTGGNSAGDFANGGQHLHQCQFWNAGASTASVTRIIASQPGMASSTSTIPGRYYMWADDVTGTCMIVCRQHGDSSCQSIVAFGLPEDEEQPLPSNIIHRLFVWGATSRVGSALIHLKTDAANNETGTVRAAMGVAFGLGYQPITCAAGSWAYATGQAIASGLLNNSTAADDVYLGASTLFGLDLYAGTYDNTSTSSGTAFQSLEPRRLGRFPFMRRGRENYNTWSTSVDQSRSYLHLEQGVFCPWSGSIIP